MPQDKNTLRLVSLCNKFNLAVADKYGSDPVKAQKLRDSFSPFDMRDIANLQQSSHTKIMEIYRKGGTQEEAEEAIAPALIKMTDIFAKAVLTFDTEENVAALMPDDAKNDRTSRAFAKQGAPNLSKLCRS